jgi:purine-cytosine permease-like protein
MTTAQQTRLRFGRFSVRLPAKRLHRLILGIGLVIGGLLWFLPVLGLWMLPLGILVLSVDYHPVRRFRRRFDVWLGKRRARSGSAKEK